MIELEPHAEGVVVPVRATAGARRDEVRGEQDGALKVAVVQVAEKGRANRALEKTLARALGLRRSQVTLLAGATGTRKRFLVRGLDVSMLRARLDRLAGEA